MTRVFPMFPFVVPRCWLCGIACDVTCSDGTSLHMPDGLWLCAACSLSNPKALCSCCERPTAAEVAVMTEGERWQLALAAGSSQPGRERR